VAQALLAKEKAATRAGDELAAQRRALPWLRVDADYEFMGVDGVVSLDGLFNGQPQLVIYHFMFGADWDEGCPSCSFWADSFDGIDVHLGARGTSFANVSAAPVEKLRAYQQRMGWSFRWVSSAGSDFNHDMGVAHTPEEIAGTDKLYNHTTAEAFGSDSPGLSVFTKHDGQIYLTYQTFARGLEVFNAAYNLLDLTPAGRGEDELEFTMSWLRRNDSYE